VVRLRSIAAVAVLSASLLPAAFAQKAATASSASEKKSVVNGYLIDVHCAQENNNDKKYAKNHVKGCLQNESCARTGYAVLTGDKKLILFDEKGNKEAQTLLKITENKEKNWKVSVEGLLRGDTIAVTALLLQ
jgi:hypothetical protein